MLSVILWIAEETWKKCKNEAVGGEPILIPNNKYTSAYLLVGKKNNVGVHKRTNLLILQHFRSDLRSIV